MRISPLISGRERVRGAFQSSLNLVESRTGKSDARRPKSERSPNIEARIKTLLQSVFGFSSFALGFSTKPRTSLCSRVSKTQPAWGSTRAACQFSWGRGRQVMHLPCKQAHMGAVPIDSTISPRGTRLKHRSRRVGNKLLQVSVIPTPATFRVKSYE